MSTAGKHRPRIATNARHLGAAGGDSVPSPPEKKKKVNGVTGPQTDTVPGTETRGHGQSGHPPRGGGESRR